MRCVQIVHSVIERCDTEPNKLDGLSGLNERQRGRQLPGRWLTGSHLQEGKESMEHLQMRKEHNTSQVFKDKLKNPKCFIQAKV